MIALRFTISIITLLHLCASANAHSCQARWKYKDDGLIFEWNTPKDIAKVIAVKTEAAVWQGSLLPSFWLSVKNKTQFIKAVVEQETYSQDSNRLSLSLRIGNIGKGSLLVTKESWGIKINELAIEWIGAPPAIIEMYFGASAVQQQEGRMGFTWDRPFMPDWQSFGYCIPGAKGGTPQSYFRMWDFGQANIALGSFGPSMGTPYGAAFPRPIYYAAMGSNEGFVSIGAGSVPDAAMSLRIQSTRGCLQYVYREDLWGALSGKKRIWKDLLCISTGETPYIAFKKYYDAFPGKEKTVANAVKPIWNTWGMWGKKKYITRPITDFARKVQAGIVVLDDPWEISQGAGKPDLKRFPDLYSDLDYIRNTGMQTGIWETMGWITDPFSFGLTKTDLICNKDGEPCRANWNFDPRETSYYCLDISSEKTRKFIWERTIRVMKIVKPAMIKLDFGYGYPSPHMGVPKNPLYRGERHSVELLRIISEAAKSVDPEIAIMYYSISPLLIPFLDLVSMDDQGDLWYEVAKGHQEWSIWASLLSGKNVSVNGSSSYNWETDDEVLLNTCVFGAPGAVLPIYNLEDETPVKNKFLNRRLAVNRWYRRTVGWTPLWLNSSFGNFNEAPKLNCWGRMEKAGNDMALTALILRKDDRDKIKDSRIATIEWEGRWALIAQDNQDIFSSAHLAIIPFDPGMLSFPCAAKPAKITKLNMEGEHPYSQWQWKDGKINIPVTEETLMNTSGFLIER